MANLNAPHIVALQMCSSVSPLQNLAWITKQLADLPTIRPLLVCLPESFLVFAKDSHSSYEVAKQSDDYQQQLSALYQQFDIWLAAGTLPVAQANSKYLAASLLFNNQGMVVAKYNKIHLFAVV